MAALRAVKLAQVSAYVRLGWTGWGLRCMSSFYTPTNGRTKPLPATGMPTGLFRNDVLSSPAGFKKISEESREQSLELVHAISKDPACNVVATLDKLSNTLCKAVDAAECMRQLHPDPAYRTAAEETVMELGSLLEQFNGNEVLHDRLATYMHKDEFKRADAETIRNGTVLMHDFASSGSGLPRSRRAQVVELKEAAMMTSFQLEDLLYAQALYRVPRAALKSLPQQLASAIRQDSHDAVFLRPEQHSPVIAWLVERGHTLNDVREEMVVQSLELLLKLRSQHARTAGFSSFAEMTLRDSMAGSPAVVASFLDELSARLRPVAEAQVPFMLRSSGASMLTLGNAASVCRMIARTTAPRDDLVENYFSVPACLAGVGLVCARLFGVELRSVPARPGEVWHPLVERVEAIGPDGALLGVLYVDLYDRPGKQIQAAHFSIQCGFRDGDTNQLPIIVLAYRFPPPGTRPTLLSYQEATVLFHEMGHALHSILSRTRYQNLSGTRCPLDLAELPSTLMERFLADHRVVSQFAHHHSTGEPIPAALHASVVRTACVSSLFDRQWTTVLSAVDQLFHAEKVPSALEGLRLMQGRHSVFEDFASGASALLRTQHLIGYSARYYSYLWTQALSSLIWNEVFAADPLSPEAGKRYLVEILSAGNSRHPRTAVEALLGRPLVAKELAAALAKDTTANVFVPVEQA